MGFNPIATFDWNVSGTGSLVTPFFSEVHKYVGTVIAGCWALAMYYTNTSWTAYLPINSNGAFNNKAKAYNVSAILGDDGYIDPAKYKKYGPPYYGAALVMEQGAWFATYSLTLSYIWIKEWRRLSKQMKEVWKSITTRSSGYAGHQDPHSRMMSRYREVPDWWFLIILLLANIFGIIGAYCWPTNTPWWSVLAVTGISAAFAIPNALLLAVANAGLNFDALWQLLAGIWFGGNPEAQMVVSA